MFISLKNLDTILPMQCRKMPKKKKDKLAQTQIKTLLI